jgi:hypothetical protein
MRRRRWTFAQKDRKSMEKGKEPVLREKKKHPTG